MSTLDRIEAVIAEQNAEASASRLRKTDIEPTKEEMMAAWELFKKEPMFGNILQHTRPEDIGSLWGCFYRGFQLGAAR